MIIPIVPRSIGKTRALQMRCFCLSAAAQCSMTSLTTDTSPVRCVECVAVYCVDCVDVDTRKQNIRRTPRQNSTDCFHISQSRIARKHSFVLTHVCSYWRLKCIHNTYILGAVHKLHKHILRSPNALGGVVRTW